MSTEIHDAMHLSVVPDGTIITWLRIPGDPTSEAVAFVRREMDLSSGTPVVWISPGGWSPQTIESAGVTFPAHVVRWGDVSVTAYTAPEVPALVETLDSGGAWNRGQALECAARVRAGDAANSRDWVTAESVLNMADTFLEWLTRDDDGLRREPVDLEAMLRESDCGIGGTCPAPTDAALAAYQAWEDRDQAADGVPTAILRGDADGLRDE
ncbi:hypothetical protein SEA_KNOCKER_60 [Mycobacterium phage Knocker]|nr:hypothetical protein SEA_KNOCKER_60 [Mycobacterium phage Knocker]